MEQRGRTILQHRNRIVFYPKYVNLSSTLSLASCCVFSFGSINHLIQVFLFGSVSLSVLSFSECLSVNMLTGNHCLNIISRITRALETVICLENTIIKQSYKSINIHLLFKPFTNLNWYQSWFNLTWLLWHSQTTLEHFVFKKCTLNSFLGILSLIGSASIALWHFMTAWHQNTFNISLKLSGLSLWLIHFIIPLKA